MFNIKIVAVVCYFGYCYLSAEVAADVHQFQQMTQYAIKIGQAYRESEECVAGKTCYNLCDGVSPPCNQFFEEVLCFIEMGKCDMPRTNIKDIVVLLGLTGAGKSTLAQFVANHTNTLRAECEAIGFCKLLDDSETTDDGIISKTFLPNLVIDNITNGVLTPFFDMPGFHDTRNISMQIANNFFIDEAIRPSDKVKIIIICLENAFASSRTDFLNIVRYLSTFLKKPESFTGSLALVANRVRYGLDVTIQVRMVKSFIRDVIADFDSVEFPSELRSNAILIMNQLSNDETDNVGVFYSPEYNGTLSEDPVFQRNKEELRTLIWDNTMYNPKQDDSFGFNLSAEAKVLLDNITASVSSDIVDELQRLATTVQDQVIQVFSEMANSEVIDYEEFTATVEALVSADYKFADDVGNAPSYYTEEIAKQIFKYGEDLTSQARTLLSKSTAFLEFVLAVKGTVSIQPKDWVAPMKNLVNDISTELKNDISNTIIDRAFTSFKNIAGTTVEHLRVSVGELQTVQEKVVMTTELEKNITSLTDSLKPILLTDSLTTALNLIETEYSGLKNCSETCVTVNGKKAAEILVLIEEFGWRSRDWLSIQTGVGDSIADEREINDFFIALLSDLSEIKVQSDFAGADLRDWWSTGPDISDNSTLFEFFNHAKSLEFSSTVKYQQDPNVFFDLLHKTFISLIRLNLLLDTTLKSFSQHSIEPDDIVFYAGFLSLKKIMSKIENQKTVVLIATNTFFLDENWVPPNQNGYKNVIIISPKVNIKSDKKIDLNGVESSQTGQAGTDAGTVYWIYQNVTGVQINGAINVDGGNGAKGRAGSQGSKGSDSLPKRFDPNSDDCAAWSGGKIRIRVYPNTCNSDECCTCHAGDGGVVVRIKGHIGGNGNRGENGGQGGDGGNAGQKYIVQVDNATSNKIFGTPGRGGEGGEPGIGGLGGRYGDVRVTTVDDVYSSGITGKECGRVTSDTFEMDNRSGATGSAGEKGISGQTGRMTTISTVGYIPYINYFVSAVEPLKANEFFRKQTLQFMFDFQKHADIPKSKKQ